MRMILYLEEFELPGELEGGIVLNILLHGNLAVQAKQSSDRMRASNDNMSCSTSGFESRLCHMALMDNRIF